MPFNPIGRFVEAKPFWVYAHFAKILHRLQVDAKQGAARSNSKKRNAIASNQIYFIVHELSCSAEQHTLLN
jgi:hypothetical protein